MQGANSRHSLGYGEDLQRRRPPKAGMRRREGLVQRRPRVRPIGVSPQKCGFRQKSVSPPVNSQTIPLDIGKFVLLFLSASKLVCEIALMGLLALLAGEKRDANFFYQLLKVLTRPSLRARVSLRHARWATTRSGSWPSPCSRCCG